MKAIDDYAAALYEVQAATLSEKILWKRTRPDAYTYKTVNSDLEDLILSLQKISNGSNPQYLFSLVKKDFESSEVLLNLDTSTTDSDLRNSLEELYNFVEYHVDMKSLDGLKDFIETIKSDDKSDSILD
jgi:hypothetical protein